MMSNENNSFLNNNKTGGLLTRMRILYSLPVFVLAITIFLFSHAPHPEFPRIGIEWEDKIAHMIAYFVFGISIILFFLSNSNKTGLKFIALTTLVIGSVYGFTDEFHQYFIPGRDAEFFDWIADIAGISLSLLFIKSLKRVINPGVVNSNRLNKQYVKK